MRVELLCLDVDGTLTDGSLIYGFANSASCGDFLQLRKARFLDRPLVLSASLASHNCKNSSTILEFASCKNAESTTNSTETALDSANSQNLGKNKSREAQPLASSGEGEGVVREGRGERLRNSQESLHSSPLPLPQKNARSEKGDSNADLSARVRKEKDLQNRDSSLRKCSAQNDKVMDFAESSAESPQDEFAEIVKVFNAKDGLALAYWCKSLNRKVAIITGKTSEILRHRAKELGIELLFMGVSDKGKIVRDLKKDLGLDSAQVACVGDDLNDISMFRECALKFAPHDCASHLKTLPNIEILRCKGGRGAVREAIETILQKEGIYEDFINFFAR